MVRRYNAMLVDNYQEKDIIAEVTAQWQHNVRVRQGPPSCLSRLAPSQYSAERGHNF